MKINLDIKTTNIDMTPAIRSYLEKRVSKLEKFIGDDVSTYAQVEIGTITSGHHSGDIFRAEINLRTGGQRFRAESKRNDLYAAIDVARDEMVRNLKSYKSKQRTLFRRGGSAIKNILKGFRKK